MPDQPQAVFFDLDGTLIDTAPDMGGALNRVLIRHGMSEVSEQQYRPHVSHGSIALLTLGFGQHLEQHHLPDLRKEFLDEYESNIAAESKLFDGIEQVLATLETLATPWGIITNKPEYLTLDLLDQLGLTERCCCIIGADTASRAKPHPEPMELACKRTGVTARECVYVGDAERDIQAGRAVGMLSLVAGWGYIDPLKDNPQNWGARAILKRPEELIPYTGA